MANLKRLQKELKTFSTQPVGNATGGPEGDTLDSWVINLKGPEKSYYKGADIKFKLNFPPDFPMKPPNLSC